MSKNAVATIDKSTNRDLQMTGDSAGAKLLPSNFGEIVQFAEMMALSGTGLPKHLRDNAGACVRIILQAVDWGMNPYGVADKTYFVNDKIAFEAQLITAVINTKAGLDGRMKYHYEGEGETRKCFAKGVIDGEEYVFETPEIGKIGTKNSPLWKNDPDQQLSYYAGRGWARRYTPEVMLGIYAPDEVKDAEPLKSNRQVESEAGTKYTKPKQIEAKPTDIEGTTTLSEDVKASIDTTQDKETDEVLVDTEENLREQSTPAGEEESQTLFPEDSVAEVPPEEKSSAAELSEEEKSPFERARPGIIEMMRLMMIAIDTRGEDSFTSVRERISSLFEKAKKNINEKSYPEEVMEAAQCIHDLVMDFCAFNEDEKSGKPLNKVSRLASEKIGVTEDDLLTEIYGG